MGVVNFELMIVQNLNYSITSRRATLIASHQARLACRMATYAAAVNSSFNFI